MRFWILKLAGERANQARASGPVRNIQLSLLNLQIPEFGERPPIVWNVGPEIEGKSSRRATWSARRMVSSPTCYRARGQSQSEFRKQREPRTMWRLPRWIAGIRSGWQYRSSMVLVHVAKSVCTRGKRKSDLDRRRQKRCVYPE